MRSLLPLFVISLLCSACHTDPSQQHIDSQPSPSPIALSQTVKSVLLYDTIQRWPIDTILAALQDINQVVASIEQRKAGYSLWKVQSDTISDYRYLIQGHWPDQASYDTIHVNPEFRKALDKNIRIFTETRKWDLYRRYELVE